MRIGIYNPYLDSLAGGERYTFTLASHWSKIHHVDIFCDNSDIATRAQDRFVLDLSRISVVPNIFRLKFFVKLFATTQYDLIFILSDGSVPWTFARHNIIHFQMPFRKVSGHFIKLSRYDVVVYNSDFTKRHMDVNLPMKSLVIYPPVDIGEYTPRKKLKIILSVGRFAGTFRAKKQDVLIDAFRKGYENGILSGWQLILAGGFLPSDQVFMNFLRAKAIGLPVQFYPNINSMKLKELYGSASLYWHACGYGEQDPQKVEHFGISTVEAMASCAIPMVYKGGGQTEIVIHDESGFLWDTPERLVNQTRDLIQKPEKIELLANNARIKAKEFSIDRFTQAYDRILKASFIT